MGAMIQDFSDLSKRIVENARNDGLVLDPTIVEMTLFYLGPIAIEEIQKWYDPAIEQMAYPMRKKQKNF